MSGPARRRGTELPWTLWGRPVKPLAAGFAAGAVGLAAVNATGLGLLGSTVWAAVVAVLGALTAAVLAAGWWARSQAAAVAGLALACGLWAGRAVTVGLLHGWGLGVVDWWISALNAAVAAGAWTLELECGPRRRP